MLAVAVDELRSRIAGRIHVGDLGGLITKTKAQVHRKVPCLGDIPILGWFFKSKSTKLRKTNLMIFLTPKIVRNDQELNQVSNASKLKLRNARNNRFRIDISKEYNIPEVLNGEDGGAPSPPKTPEAEILHRD